MKKLTVNTDDLYEIIIENDILDNVGFEINNIYKNKKIAIVTDENVFSIYGHRLETALTKYNYLPFFIVIKPGEQSKSVGTLMNVYSKFIDFGITRKDLIIAFGGGVVGDLTGFAASTYLRGIDYIQVPTTLLAQVDSSVGGKTAINMKQGKNLVGSFYNPKKVIIDTAVLNSLSDKYIKDGLGEVIKYGCIKNSELFDTLLSLKDTKNLFKIMEQVIFTCCSIKRDIVEKDEKDTGTRMLLNFGHTFGHALEKYFNYDKYTHGEAVALGMYYITKKSEALGYTELGTAQKIKEILNKYNISYRTPDVNIDEILKIINLDKKNLSSSMNLILIEKIGSAFIKNVPTYDLNKFIN